MSHPIPGGRVQPNPNPLPTLETPPTLCDPLEVTQVLNESIVQLKTVSHCEKTSHLPTPRENSDSAVVWCWLMLWEPVLLEIYCMKSPPKRRRGAVAQK